ncbi:MAG: hypothetical protein WCK39_06310 [Methanomassiliicoccales archaeon]
MTKEVPAKKSARTLMETWENPGMGVAIIKKGDKGGERERQKYEEIKKRWKASRGPGRIRSWIRATILRW